MHIRASSSAGGRKLHSSGLDYPTLIGDLMDDYGWHWLGGWARVDPCSFNPHFTPEFTRTLYVYMLRPVYSTVSDQTWLCHCSITSATLNGEWKVKVVAEDNPLHLQLPTNDRRMQSRPSWRQRQICSRDLIGLQTDDNRRHGGLAVSGTRGHVLGVALPQCVQWPPGLLLLLLATLMHLACACRGMEGSPTGQWWGHMLTQSANTTDLPVLETLAAAAVDVLLQNLFSGQAHEKLGGQYARRSGSRHNPADPM